jgi:hypothetical protein
MWFNLWAQTCDLLHLALIGPENSQVRIASSSLSFMIRHNLKFEDARRLTMVYRHIKDLHTDLGFGDEDAYGTWKTVPIIAAGTRKRPAVEPAGPPRPNPSQVRSMVLGLPR